MANITIDADKFKADFTEFMQGHVAAHNAAADVLQAANPLLSIPKLDASGITGEICKDWPLAEKFAKEAQAFSWIMPAQIRAGLGVLLAVMAALDKSAIAELCPVHTSTGAAPASH